MLEHLDGVNNVKIRSVRDPEFAPLGRVVTGYDFSGLISYMEGSTEIPESGNICHTSEPGLEADPVKAQVENGLYGGMEVEIGYCNGRNTTYNGFEYHKGSEINIAVTSFMLVLDHSWEVRNNTYRVEDTRVFFVEKGTVTEMYQTTLRLSPCRVTDEGLKGIVLLSRRTNTPLTAKPDQLESENRLLLQRSKWVIAHPERESLTRQGAFPGLLGENKKLRY